ncbi:unnamed protein product [Cylicocyclus nassatus]|uniref:Uncharacterized protein n=1 Tax=Cylicocyclus nassatus TaxID=53992 RepID=A0AA36DVV9_CYLNA|nr:unnamed protein product [Cylicocyclus nassatus]
MGYYQKLAWFDVCAAPICLLWFMGLCYLFCVGVVRPFLIKKDTAKRPFLFWGEREKKQDLLEVAAPSEMLSLEKSK